MATRTSDQPVRGGGMEFLYARFVEWMKQKLVQTILAGLVRHMLTIVSAVLLAVAMSTIAVRAIMPVERSRMFMVPRESSSASKDGIVNYYGFVNVDQSPTAGFHYKAQLIFRHLSPPSNEDRRTFRGKVRVILRSPSGIAVVDKSAGFKVSAGGDPAVAFTEFPVGRLLAPVHDGSLRLLLDERENTIFFGHVEIRFSLDCSGDMYTRLLCFRPTKWAVVAWTWAALYSAVMTVVMSFLLATKIMNLFLTEFLRTLLRGVNSTLRRQCGRLLRRLCSHPPKPAAADGNAIDDKELPAEESIDDLIGKIKAASVLPGESAGSTITDDGAREGMPLPTIVIDTSNLVEEDRAEDTYLNETDNVETEYEGREEVHLTDSDTKGDAVNSHGQSLWSEVVDRRVTVQADDDVDAGTSVELENISGLENASENNEKEGRMTGGSRPASNERRSFQEDAPLHKESEVAQPPTPSLVETTNGKVIVRSQSSESVKQEGGGRKAEEAEAGPESFEEAARMQLANIIKLLWEIQTP